MTDHDVLYGYRLALFDLAARTTVSHACRTFGVHRSTYYAWKRQVDRHGLEMLRPRERRRPADAQPAFGVGRAADHRLLTRPSGSRSAAGGFGAPPAEMGRRGRLG